MKSRRDEDRNLERLVVVMMMINYYGMFFYSLTWGWKNWIPAFIVGAAAIMLIVYIGKYFDYNTRTRIYAFLLMLGFTVFSVNTDSLLIVIVPFITNVVLLGLSGNEKTIIFPTISIVFLILFHGLVKQSFGIKSFFEVYEYSLYFVNAFLVLIYIKIWLSKRNVSQKNIRNVISKLESAQRSKDDFLANVSHELRTPINSINGMSEILLSEDLPKDIREKIEYIQMSGKSLLAVVNDLLDFTELQSGKFVFEESSYSIDSTINDIVNMTNSQKNSKPIEIIVDCNPTIPRELCGVEAKIKQVAMNVISNAIKFTNDGCIVIKFDYREENYGINLCITVKDTGIGMDNGSLENIFTSFSQVDSKRNRQEGGIGLGLAISKVILEKMGGFIQVKSELGVGTEVKMIIPQKISNSESIIKVDNSKKQNMLVYIDMEQFKMSMVRDEYNESIKNIAKFMNAPLHMCHNLAELKRRVEQNYYSQIFISVLVYKMDKSYFNKIANNHNLIVILESNQENEVESEKIIKLPKPIYIFPVMAAIESAGNNENGYITSEKNRKFTAPTAKIMIVDDNEINLKVACGLIKPFKIQVDTALSGFEALKLIENQKYDMIFMDHMMPEMDGVETVKKIRQKNGLYYKEVPVVALTANAVPGAREMLLEEGFQAFMSKPIDLSVLKRTLRNFLPEEKIEYSSLEEDKVVEDKNSSIEKDNEESSKQDPGKQELKIGDIDFEQGIKFCGSKENLMEVLKLHFEDGKDNYNKISSAFMKNDWKNYVIYVHGLKSSMKTVGINKLSELALNIEMAGKAEDFEYILANHEQMLDEYSRILDVLAEMFNQEMQQEEDLSEYEDLSDEQMKDYISKFEEAVFDFDENEMSDIILEIGNYKFHGHLLSVELKQIYNKIQNSDYMSALDKLKQKVANLEKEGE